MVGLMLKKYDIVKKRCGFWDDRMTDSSFDPEEPFIIEYSYGEKYGNGSVYGGYSIRSLVSGGGSAWWDEDKLIFIREGTEEDLRHAENMYDENVMLHKDLTWIANNWPSISTCSILELFKEIGYDSGFERHGEFYLLHMDWVRLSHIFECLFNGDLEGMHKTIKLTFKQEYVEKYTKAFEILLYKINLLKIS